MLKTGQTSLRSVVHGETFHPVVGPEAEARILHVEQQKLVERSQVSASFVIWDVGFGAAANVMSAIEATRGSGSMIEIHSFDKTISGVEFALKHSAELRYLHAHHDLLHDLLTRGHVQIASNMNWHLHLGDFRDIVKGDTGGVPDAVLYDPYSPGTNPEMWTLDHFEVLFGRLRGAKPCLLTNYTRSTAVRVTLLLAGFYVGVGCSVGEKEETTVAGNCPKLVGRLLDRAWLERVRISSNAAPLRLAGQSRGAISDLDFERLSQCQQFRHAAC